MHQKIKIPVLINDRGAIKKIVYVQLKKDGSVYVYFPNKRPYRIARHVADIKLRPGTQEIKLLENKSISGSPYISYHPANGKIHSNLQPTGRYILDTPVTQIDNDEGLPCFPLCQVILSSTEFLDVYRNGENPAMVTIEVPNGVAKAIQIEFYIHPKDRHIEMEDLPLIKDRMRLQEILQFATYINPFLHSLTVSVLVTAIPLSSLSDGIPGLHVIVWKKGGPAIFELQPM